VSKKTGRNDLCPCGSGKKYKKCCLGKVLPAEPVKPSTSLVTAGYEPEIFNSLNDVLLSLRNEGYEPVISDHIYDESDGFESYEIDLYCKHGHSDESRSYWVLKDGRLECVECGFGGDPCPYCYV